MTRRRLTNAALLMVAFALVTGSGVPAHAQGKAKKGKQTVVLPVWPLPPEPARIRFLDTFRGAADFRKKPSRWKSALLGNPEGGTPSDAFSKPYGVAVAPDGRIYVSDTAARRVFVIDPEASTFTSIGQGGDTTLAKPMGIAVDAGGTVFVVDATLKRVFGFAPDGSLALAIGRDGELDSPTGLALDRARRLLYVVDTSQHHILCYSTADGALVRTIGKRGSGTGEFNFPTNVSVDGEGRVYVSDTLNFRVQVFDAAGTVLRVFGTLGDSPGTFNRPKGLAVDSEGHIYVADSAFGNVQLFDAEGQLLLTVGRGGAGLGQFLLPAGLFIDDHDRIYVADQGNARVQVFQYIRAATP